MAMKLIDFGYFSTDLTPDSTGLPFIVFAYPKWGSRCNARIKISRSRRLRRHQQLLSVEIGPPVRVIRNGCGPDLTQDELDLLFRWVELNRAALIRHWNGETGSWDIIQSVKPVSPV
jgi:hypothetical protein